jgi:hypothetical protein
MTRLLSIVMLGGSIGVAAAAEPAPVRIASGVSGHIHPALCVTKSGAIVVVFGQSDMKDLRVARSTDGGRSWTEPVAFEPSIDEQIYPGSLTTLADGRVVHFWNRWLEGRKEPRWPVYSVSSDDGATWGPERALPQSQTFTRVIRHPIVELSADRWLVSCSDVSLIHHPQSGKTETYADGRTDPPDARRPVVPIVRTPRGTLVSGIGLRSTDDGKTWQKLAGMPDIASQGWRHDLACLPNGWLLASEVLGEGVGGHKFRYVVSHDDGLTWSHYVDFHDPGRPIGGRACPRAVQVDRETVGIVFYDTDAAQPGGAGVFFLRLPLTKFGPS